MSESHTEKMPQGQPQCKDGKKHVWVERSTEELKADEGENQRCVPRGGPYETEETLRICTMCDLCWEQVVMTARWGGKVTVEDWFVFLTKTPAS